MHLVSLNRERPSLFFKHSIRSSLSCPLAILDRSNLSSPHSCGSSHQRIWCYRRSPSSSTGCFPRAVAVSPQPTSIDSDVADAEQFSFLFQFSTLWLSSNRLFLPQYLLVIGIILAFICCQRPQRRASHYLATTHITTGEDTLLNHLFTYGRPSFVEGLPLLMEALGRNYLNALSVASDYCIDVVGTYVFQVLLLA